MKYLKFLIIFFSIIIIVLAVMLFTGVLKNEEGNNIATGFNENIVNNTFVDNNIIQELPEDEEQNVTIKNNIKQLSYVNSTTDYFTVKSLYDNYINLIGNKNKKKMMNILSPQYIESYNITESNIFNVLKIPELENTRQYYKTNITDMLSTKIDDTTYVYIVKGKCRLVGKNTIFSVQVMFEIDTLNKLYYAYPYQYINDKGINKLENGAILNSYNKEEINNKDYNKFNSVVKSDTEIANEYFNNYCELIKYYKDEAYSKLESSYAEKRFGNKNGFESYLEENKEVLYYMNINQYKVVTKNNYTDYICADEYDNIYIFRQKDGIMRYSAFLDNYTIMLDMDKEEYNKLDKVDKSKYNLNKFINMVNTKDYNALYDVLDDTFKTNNFKSKEELKKFILNNMYSLNELEINNAEVEKYQYYVFECSITNKKNNQEKKNMTIIINQTEGTNFTMSFSFE